MPTGRQVENYHYIIYPSNSIIRLALNIYPSNSIIRLALNIYPSNSIIRLALRPKYNQCLYDAVWTKSKKEHDDVMIIFYLSTSGHCKTRES
jgi:hypothetical protein